MFWISRFGSRASRERWARLAAAAGGLVLLLAPVCCMVPPAEPPAVTDAPLREDGALDFLRPDGTRITRIKIQIAADERARRQGLMGRRLSDPSHGMLFVCPLARAQAYWMRHTPTSLDVIFVGSDGRVINVARNTVPMSDRKLFSARPAQYVVEVLAGFTERHGIRPGTRVRWQEK